MKRRICSRVVFSALQSRVFAGDSSPTWAASETHLVHCLKRGADLGDMEAFFHSPSGDAQLDGDGERAVSVIWAKSPARVCSTEEFLTSWSVSFAACWKSRSSFLWGSLRAGCNGPGANSAGMGTDLICATPSQDMADSGWASRLTHVQPHWRPVPTAPPSSISKAMGTKAGAEQQSNT